ncbi:MAG TPA: T9SS type A sorting domain-containing protein [Bacteroidia bacterium]
MRKLLFTICFLSISLLKAQTPYVAIPDSNFVHYLKTIVPSAFKGDSLNTTSTLVTTTTHTISCGGMVITNLSGVQYFTSLTCLICFQNSLTTLPALPNSLIEIHCAYNALTTLPALPNSLQIYDGNQNNLTTLPALPNSLTSLDCGYNSLTSLPALPNSLQSLSCGYNSLTVLPALPNALRELAFQNNSITSLPVLPDSLKTLFCDHNNITCFPPFPNTIYSGYFNIDPNPYNCLPNYISAMSAADLAKPLCATGNSNGCPVAVAGIQQFANSNEVSIYPNPSNGSFIIEPSNNTKQTVNVYDVNGKLVLSQTLNGKTTIDASSLNEGVYNISISSDEGIVNKRLVIVK